MTPGIRVIPFLPLLLALMAGIGLQLFLPAGAIMHRPAWLFYVLPVIVLALSWYLRKRWSTSIYAYVMLLPLHGLLGFWIAGFAQHTNAVDFFKTVNSDNSGLLELRITEPLAPKANTWRASADVTAVLDSVGNKRTVSGKVLVYWPKRTNSQKPVIEYGDVLICPDLSMPMPSAAFPDDFDFKAVMRYRNVQHQIFLSSGSFKVIGNSANPLFHWAFICREWVIKTLKEQFSKNDAALMASLLIGYKDEMDAESLKAFSLTGTMHVLAVSGMHVGLIYLALIFLFTGRTKDVKVLVWQGIFIILLLWAYAFITGLSASVLRAALMFTIIETGRIFLSREGQTLNSVFAAAYVQLLISPLNLIDVGFQLSYAAVIGILLFYPLLIRRYMPANKYLAWVYQLGMVSIAATIGTMPVSLYFFHNFPVLFLPANLFIVPLSSLIIFGGIAFLIISPIAVLAKWLSVLLSLGLDLMVSFANALAEIKWSVIKGINTDPLDVALIYLIIAGLFGIAVLSNRKYAVFFTALFVLVFSVKQTVTALDNANRKELIVCELKNHLISVVRNGNNISILSNPVEAKMADSLFGFMANYRLKNGIKHVEWVFHSKPIIPLGSAGFYWQNKTYTSHLMLADKPFATIAWLPDTAAIKKLTCPVFIQYRYRRYVQQDSRMVLLRNNFFRQSF